MFVQPGQVVEYALEDGSGPPIMLCSTKAKIKTKLPWVTFTFEKQINEIRADLYTFPRNKIKKIFRQETLIFLKLLPRFEKHQLDKSTEEQFHACFATICVLREILFGKVLPLTESLFVGEIREVDTMPAERLRKV